MPRKLPPTFPDDPKPWKVRKREYLSREFWYTVRVDEVVLIRQYRHGLEQVHFEIPAGTTDPGETELEPAARRELLEETGYGGGRWSLLIKLSANPALQDNLAHTFLAEGVERLAEPHTEDGEDLRVHLVPVIDIERLIDEGEFIQALHIAPLLKYLLGRRSHEGAR